MYPSLYLLFAAIRKDSTVALPGEAADEVFGGYRWFHEQKRIDAHDFPWSSYIPNLTHVTHPALARDIRLTEYVSDAYSQTLRETPVLQGVPQLPWWSPQR
jgi:asparagine synthase (glutamine-hydrolysing)